MGFENVSRSINAATIISSFLFFSETIDDAIQHEYVPEKQSFYFHAQNPINYIVPV
jgi:hypothetical protein